MPRSLRLDRLGPRPNGPYARLARELESQLFELRVQHGRLLANAAAALERIQVAERDKGGALDEAEAILSSVVRLDGTYVQKEHVHEWRPVLESVATMVCRVPGCKARTTRAALVADDFGCGEPSDF